MAYTKQTWEDEPSTATPLSAARLNYIESGIEAAAAGGGGGGVTLTGPQTISGTRVSPRVLEVVNQLSWTINSDLYDVAINTGLTNTCTIQPPTGTPTNGQRLLLSFTGTTSRALVFSLNPNGFEPNTTFTSLNGMTTTATSRFDAEFVWNATSSKWRYVMELPVALAGSNQANSIAQRNANGWLVSGGFATTAQTTVSSGGTTAMGTSYGGTQIITGTTTHTMTLPGAGVPVAAWYRFINTSTGAVTINSSAGNLVKTLAPNSQSEITALVTSPTTNAQWFAT